MSVTHAGAIRDLLANVTGDAHDVGSAGAAVLQIRDSTTVLVEFPLEDPAFSTASSADGIIAAAGTPIEVAAEADGDADNFVTLDQDGAIVLAGSVTGTGMGGDIEVTNPSIANLQDCSLETLTYEAPP